jgi:hypothetical protein
LLYSRITQKITAIRDGNSVSVGQMVRYSDMYDPNQQSGYIKSRTGNTFITSERIEFIGSMYVVVTDYLGQPTDKVIAAQIPGNPYGFIAALPEIELAIFDGEETNAASRYIIASATVIDETLWVVTEKQPGEDEKTSLTLVEYSDEMYEYGELLTQFTS